MTPSKSYKKLLNQFLDTIQIKKNQALIKLHQILVEMYWELGSHIVHYLQNSGSRAGYKEETLHQLSMDLTEAGERGFSVTQLKYVREFYYTYPDIHLLRQGITWSHYKLLIRLQGKDSRRFYEEMTLQEKWSVRELEQQIKSLLYERTLSRQKERTPPKVSFLKPPEIKDAFKDPYILDFLHLEEGKYLESDLEEALISDMEKFLLELGYGFAFLWRQRRIELDTTPYYVDLVFFHRGLLCLVLIDLKIGKFTHTDVGQMNLYLNYFRNNERYKWEKDPIGIILCADKEEDTVQYALGQIDQKIFVSSYKTHLPSEESLRLELTSSRQEFLKYSASQGHRVQSQHPRKNLIIECLKKDPKLTTSSYWEICKLSRPTAQRDLSRAVEEGWLQRLGKGRGAYYILP